MQQSSLLVSLPEPVLYHICSLIISPFDLLHFGSTCKRLWTISSPPSLWLKHVFSWCEGMWQWIEIPEANHPRDWLIELFRSCCSKHPKTLRSCHLGSGEEWIRRESKQFRCMLGMLRYSYADRDERYNPKEMYRRWIFDIGLYHRTKPRINFFSENFTLDSVAVKELVELGQAKERDLRLEEPRFSNLCINYYIKRIKSSCGDWCEELFSAGPCGSLCPLLLCPSEVGYSSELTGPAGVATLVSIVLAKYFSPQCLNGQISLPPMVHMIQKACCSLKVHLDQLLPIQQQQWKSQPLANSVMSMAFQGLPSLDAWQVDLDKLHINLHWKEIMLQCSRYLEENHWLDSIVDNIRIKWRHALLEEIRKVLEGSEEMPRAVTRVNLTDCDLIGGDNRRQQMAAAAFISNIGVLVTWQLVGKINF